MIGIGEIVLLPLDALKIKMQTNAAQFAGKSSFEIIRQEGMGLYRGATWTAARNAPGSFALFGASAFTKEYLFNLQDYSKATFFQNFVASIAGAIASITISAPLDVIKTRIQSRSSVQAESGWTIVKNMVAKEGFGSFFKVTNYTEHFLLVAIANLYFSVGIDTKDSRCGSKAYFQFHGRPATHPSIR